MAINNDIITQQKLFELERVSHFHTWEESKVFVNPTVLGEMDRYLIDGLFTDYLQVIYNKKHISKTFFSI